MQEDQAMADFGPKMVVAKEVWLWLMTQFALFALEIIKSDFRMWKSAAEHLLSCRRSFTFGIEDNAVIPSAVYIISVSLYTTD